MAIFAVLYFGASFKIATKLHEINIDGRLLLALWYKTTNIAKIYPLSTKVRIQYFLYVLCQLCLHLSNKQCALLFHFVLVSALQ